MKYYSRYILIILFLIQALYSFGQNCTEYHIDHCRWADRSFLYSRQSKSAAFKPGMKSEFSIVVYGGEEYYLSVDGHKKLGNIRIRLIEDNTEQTILYDNAQFKYENFFYFKNSLTKNLIVEITSEVEDDEITDDIYCIGVLIEFRSNTLENRKDKLGF